MCRTYENTTPSYIRDLSNQGFWYPQESWNQSLEDTEGWLYTVSTKLWFDICRVLGVWECEANLLLPNWDFLPRFEWELQIQILCDVNWTFNFISSLEQTENCCSFVLAKAWQRTRAVEGILVREDTVISSVVAVRETYSIWVQVPWT